MSYEPWKVGQKVGQVRPPEPVLTRGQKLRHVLIGFLGWWLVNYLVMEASSGGELFGFYEFYNFLVLAVLPGNVLAFVVLAKVNRWLALGFAAAFVSLFVVIYVGNWILFIFFWR